MFHTLSRAITLFLAMAASVLSARAVPFEELWQPKSAPPLVDGPAASPPSGSAVSVHVYPDRPVRRVSPALFGNNGAVWDGDRLMQTGTLDSLRRAGVRVLRFPGGSTSDEYCWDGNYTSLKSAYGVDNNVYNQAWAVDTDEFIGVCRAIGAEPMITVNFGLARYGSVEEATDLAARWVKYCNVDHDYRVRYWEVGNETYGDWERGTLFPPNTTNRLTGQQYGELFNRFVAAMKAVDPTIHIGAVALGVDDTDPWNGYYGWMRQMLPVVKDTADFLSVHNYFTWLGGTAQSSPSALFASAAQISQWKANLDTMVQVYAQKTPDQLPCAMTEFNIENPPKHDTVELTNGLFAAIALGEYARTGWAAANYWDVLNGWDGTTGGDHAFLAVNQPGVANGTQRAPLYAYALWSLFGDTFVGSSGDSAAVKVYGGTYSAGGVSAILVNTEVSAHTITLDAGSGSRASKANLWVLDGDSFSSQSVRYNGVLGPAGGGPADISKSPPYLVDVPAQGAVTFGLPSRSAALLVLVPRPLPGDLNDDGIVDLLDASLAARAAAGLSTLSESQRARADLNGDATFTTADIALILSRSAGGASS